MAHRRSPAGAAKQYISRMAFRDMRISETVSRSTQRHVVAYLRTLYDEIDYSELPYVEPGLVLVNSRGEGTFQM